MPPKLKVRVTSKMLDILTPPEMRLICLMLGMPVMQSWKASPKERQTWLLENLTKFVEVDLEKQNWAMFRTPVKDYCMALQAYASGDGPLPVFNPLMEELDEAQPIKYEETPLWERTEEDAEEEEKEEILEEISTATAEVVPPVVTTEETTSNEEEKPAVKEEASAKRFVLKKNVLSAKAAKEPKPAEEPAATEAPVVPAVEEVKLPAVRAVNQNYPLDDKIQVIGDLVEKLCQVVTKQQHQMEKLIELNLAQVGLIKELADRPNKFDDLLKDNDLFNKALLVLLNSTVLADTPLTKLEEVMDVQFED